MKEEKVLSKKIILSLVPLEENQKLKLEEVATDYEVVEKNPDFVDFESVEIMYGWDEEISEKILTTSSNQLKWIQAQSAGVDHIELDLLKKQKILLSNASGIHGNQMSESILGMIFSHTRGIQTAVLNQKNKLWIKPNEPTDLADKNIMIVGTGHIGIRLAEILRVFGVNLFGVNRTGRKIPGFDEVISQNKVQELLPEMDIVINLLPDNDETHYFFTKKIFHQMKTGVIFINVGRGGTVNTSDLISACQSHQVGFAGLDVFEEEPLPNDSPLWQLENVLITPHSSGMTDKYFKRLFPLFLENLTAFIETQKLMNNEVKLN